MAELFEMRDAKPPADHPPPPLAPPPLSLVFDDSFTEAQREILASLFRSWPPSVRERLAPVGILMVRSVPLQTEPLAWGPGLITFRQGRWNEERLTFEILLQPLYEELSRVVSGPAGRPVLRTDGGPLVPFSPSLLRGVVREMTSRGLEYRAGRLLQIELGLVQTAKEAGGGSHQLRLRVTNPAFNRWVYRRFVDPFVPVNPDPKFYWGAFGAVGTTPFSVIGTAAVGADAHLTLLGGTHLFLDSNVQYRTRSGVVPDPSDGLAVEVFPRIEDRDRRLAFGMSAAALFLPTPGIRGSLVGRYIF